MKRISALLLTVILCLSLAACNSVSEAEQAPRGIHMEATDAAGAAEKRQNDSPEESVQRSMEWVGPWHLDSEKNDLAAFADSLDLFPGYGEWGASMEIRSNGQMSWYIGAEGWHGTYTVADGVIHAQLISDLEQTSRLWDFRIIAEDEAAELEMAYQGMTIYWAYGDREDVPEMKEEF